MHFDLVAAAPKYGRAAARAEMPPPELTRLAFDCHCVGRKEIADA